MKRRKVALDIDGVIADTSRIIKERVSEVFGLDKRILRSGHDYTNVYRLKDKELHDEVNEYVRELFQTDSEVYDEAEEVDGAWFGARYVSPVAYITRRPEAFGIRESTVKWLNSRRFPEAEVYFIPKGTCKSEKAKELGCNLLIEDSPYEILSCHDNGLDILAMRYPYNLDVIKERGITSVASWKEAILWMEGELNG